MLIKYSGHACFKIRDNETGYSIVFDPYEPGSVPGYEDLVDTASEVICSHDHFDHNYRDAIKLEPAEESPFDVQFIDAWHDEVKGAKRGPNRVHIITDRKTGERLIHYGDLGEEIDDFLTEENLALLKDADVALIPVGGFFTIDADQAIDLIKRTTPKLVLPMHYRAEAAGFGFSKIGSIEDFLFKAAGTGLGVSISDVWFYDTAENDLSDAILVLRPYAIGRK